MKLSSHFLDGIREQLRGIDGPFGLDDVDIYLGPSPLSEQPSLQCRLTLLRPVTSAAIDEEVLTRLWPELVSAPPLPGSAGAEVAALVGQLVSRILVTLHNMPSTWQAVASATDQTMIVTLLDENLAGRVLAAAITFVAEQLASGRIDRSGPMIAGLRAEGRRHRIDNSTARLTAAARRRNIPVVRTPDFGVIVQYGWGARSEMFMNTSPNCDGMIGAFFGRDKTGARGLFQALGLPVAAGIMVGADQDHRVAADKVGWPCVVKPVQQGEGRGVTANIRTPEALDRAVAFARSYGPMILIEAFQPGADHRLMVVDFKLVAAASRVSPSVTGDGVRTVRTLNQARNAARRGPDSHETMVIDVVEDDALRWTLADQGLTLDSVPAAGVQVVLRGTANVSRGGSCTASLSKVHPEVKDWAEMIARTAGLRCVGIDYLSPDVSRPHREVGGAFIEMNCTPGLALPLGDGPTPEELAEIVLGDRAGRIPAGLVVATDDALREVAPRLRAEVSRIPGAALVLRDQSWVGATPVAQTTMTLSARVNIALRHRDVEQLIIAWPEQDLLHNGMPVDRVAETWLLAPDLPAPWIAMLRSQSERFGIYGENQSLPAAMFRALVS